MLKLGSNQFLVDGGGECHAPFEAACVSFLKMHFACLCGNSTLPAAPENECAVFHVDINIFAAETRQVSDEHVAVVDFVKVDGGVPEGIPCSPGAVDELIKEAVHLVRQSDKRVLGSRPLFVGGHTSPEAGDPAQVNFLF